MIRIHLYKNAPALFLKSLLFFLSFTCLAFAGVDKPVGEVKHVANMIAYVNIGKNHGVSVGDSLVISRKGKRMGTLFVRRISNLSSACRWKILKSKPRQGDHVKATRRNFNATASVFATSGDSSVFRSAFKETTPQRKRSRKRNTRRSGWKGQVAFQSVLLNDLGSSGLNYQQFGARTRIKAKSVFGLPFDFRFRWRSRAHDRVRQIGSPFDSDWTHSVYEFGLISNRSAVNWQAGFGRILSPEIRGIGYIDGGLFSYRLNQKWQFGVAGGTEPNLSNSAFRTDAQKIGMFANFETGEIESRKLSSSLAFSSSYNKGEVNREFFYLQNNLWWGKNVSLYQTIEFDINRGWKKAAAGNTIEASNFYLNLRVAPMNALSFFLNYDARKRLRTFESRSVPDSLFDETIRRGIRAGLTVRFNREISLSGNVGLRARNGNIKDTFSFSSALRARRLLRTRASLSLQLTFFSTQFSSAYRPAAYLRLPIGRRFSTSLAVGSYIYEIVNQTTSNRWAEIGGSWQITRKISANLGYKLYAGGQIESQRFYFETGLSF